ncbi:MAG: hypothetical protein GFH27_549279n220 [Chloroflexi bacterium AL-W]|nr:hypothetical protein [Chloroflexi bacterium AL-N1]NOK65186.1 hypothetical protein [Chloroflexi bacterium AL-N10]NOK72548.1 hypothetical protein [Chloroflexi bacterium AL-N5]NOK79365.1 hypothetical protein [Chloroflexi bacterium AL-W]NOK87281.1 hypothetical protein [Chloroflexi bacterium AL-N15]
MISIDLGSTIVTNTILLALAVLGWVRGFRYMLSIAFFLTIAYLLTIQGGDFIIGFINRFYTNLPPLGAFLLGNDPGTVQPLPPLIPDNFQAPLLLRVLVFISLLAVGIGYAWPWEGKLLNGFGGFRPLRILGTLTGLYIAVLLISAISSFWVQAAGAVALPDLATVALNGLPNFAGIIPSVIAAFAILVGVIIILRFNRILRPDK